MFEQGHKLQCFPQALPQTRHLLYFSLKSLATDTQGSRLEKGWKLFVYIAIEKLGHQTSIPNYSLKFLNPL